MLHSDKTFACDICSKTFSQPRALRRHKMTHSTLNPFQCQECGYSSKRADTLTDHMNKQHPSKQHPMPFQCTMCPKAFAQAGNLNSHLLIHSQGRPVKSESERTFPQPSSLATHFQSKYMEYWQQ